MPDPLATKLTALAALMQDTQALARQERIFQGLIADMQMAIDEFGYEAVYFGVGCKVFPDEAHCSCQNQ